MDLLVVLGDPASSDGVRDLCKASSLQKHSLILPRSKDPRPTQPTILSSQPSLPPILLCFVLYLSLSFLLMILMILFQVLSFTSVNTPPLSLSLSLCFLNHYQPLQSTSGPMLVPPWLEPLLSTTFFSVCHSHISLPRSECNMFCIDCNHKAFCFYCRSMWHQHHQVIQIRRSSYHDVVRVSEIHKVLDISGVQTYVINSARVIFLNERPQPKTNTTNSGAKNNSHLCEICRRSLLDSFCFCSLGCKLVGIKKNIEREAMGRRLISKQEKVELREGRIQKQQYQSLHHPLQQASSYSNSRRRKGTPHRAPLGP